MIKYCLGCIIAAIYLGYTYYHTPVETRVERTEACIVYVVGICASWVTIIILILAGLFKDETD